MLAGRTLLGSILFKDTSINLHSINSTDDKITTRWTLRTTVKAIPWQPTARFTGISEYTVRDNKILSQVDYWDSINLVNGAYKQASTIDAIKDFVSQLQDSRGNAELAFPELPYELLRRGMRYEVRRYPETIVAETEYDQRPEGYDRLGSYAGGSNSESRKLNAFSPTVISIRDDDQKRRKLMSWPLSFATPMSKLNADSFPPSTISGVTINQRRSRVVAVARFDVAATEPVVR